jgi:hypothetical protein
LNSTYAPNFVVRGDLRICARWVFGLYAILIVPIYCLPVCTPDEAWFAHDAKMFADSWRGLSNWQVLFGQQNHLGYGAAYWILYALSAKLTIYPLVVMRIVAYAANLSIPYLLLRQSRDVSKQPAAICAMLIWCSFTAAWWTGKVTGPELFSTALVFGGLHSLANAKRSYLVLVTGMLIGMGVGLKSNAAPAALALFFVVPQLQRPWRSLSVVLAGATAGFVLANPFVLVDPTALLTNIRRHDKFGAGYTTNHLAEVLWNTSWEWEGVFRGGYFNWGMSPLALPIYFAFLWKSKLSWKWFAGGLGCTVAGFLLYLTSRTYQGWYWLPLLTLFPLTVLQIRKMDRATWRLGMAVVLVNVVSNVPWIGLQYFGKFEQLAHSFRHDEVLKEARTIAAAPRKGLLVTVLDQGIELEKPTSRSDSKVGRPVSDLSGFFLLNELRFGRRELAPGETWLVIHDQRLRQYNPIVDPLRDASRFGPGYEISLQPGNYVSTLRIHRKALAAQKASAKR